MEQAAVLLTPTLPDELFRASSMPRRAACPGSARMELGLDDIASKWADEGTNLHAAVWDKELRKDMSADQLQALEWVDERLASFEGITWHPEQQVQVTAPGLFDPEIEVLISRGTSDGIGVYPPDHEMAGRVVVVDFKFGYNPVDDPIENEQFAAYAAGAMQRFGASEAECILLQPRLRIEASYTFTDPDAITKSLRRIRNTASRRELVLNSGPQCTYCRARGFCPELRANEQYIQEADEVALSMIRPENARLVYDIVKSVEAKSKVILARVRDVVKEAQDSGGQVEGLKISMKSGARKITDLVGAYERVKDILRMDEFLAVCKVEVGKLEEIIARGGKQAGRWPSIVKGKEWFAQNVPTETGEPTEEMRKTK